MKQASANVNREDTNDDIIVTTVEGYMYQIYYDEVTEQKFIEYVGKENKGTLPNLKTTYNKEKATLSAEVKNTSEVDVEKMELIYRGDVIDTQKGATATFSNLQYTGWYMVRVTATSGQMRYAWIRVSSTVIAPNIEIISNGEPVNDWYGADNVPLKVKISTDNATAKGINYYIANAITKEETRVEGKSVVLEKELQKETGKTVSGTITITAWVDDGEGGNVSETATVDIKYDSIKPTLAYTITPNKDAGKTWYNSEDVTISLSGSTDANSGVAKYKYRYIEKDPTDTDEEFNQEYKEVTDYKKTPITIEKDGIRKVEIVVVDNAGNESTAETIEIYKDSTEPEFITDEINITDVTEYGFRINTDAKDNLSGNPARDPNYKIMYKYSVKPQNGEPLTLQNNVTENNYYIVTGLTPNVVYIVTVEATDMAENKATQTDKQQKTLGELLIPDIKFEPSEPTNNGWYNQNVKAIITDTATQERTGSKKIVYDITGKNTQIGDARKVETTLDGEGKIDVTAHVEDDTRVGSKTTTRTVYIDKTAPDAPTVVATATPDGENEWYRKEVSLKITGIADKEKSGVNQISGADKVIYKIDSGDEKPITLEGTNITEKDIEDLITADGNHTITAWTQDKAGNRSNASTVLNINKDSTAPSTATLAKGTEDYHKIPVTAKGEDATSGVASYEFQIATENKDTSFKTVETISAKDLEDIGTSTYTYADLTTATTYYFRVIVTDNAGNTKTSEVVTGTTKGDLQAPNITLASTEQTDNIADTSDETWRKGNISVTITDSANNTNTSATQIKYEIKKGETIVKSETQDGLTVTLDKAITTDGTYTITAWAVGRGGTSAASTRTVKRDTVAPAKPTLAVSKGTQKVQNSGWYTSNVDVKITAGNDVKGNNVNEVSGSAKIKYKIDGADKPEVTGTETNVTDAITTDGVHTVVAYTVDAAGNTSEVSDTLEIKRDTQAPSAPTLADPTGTKNANDWFTSDATISASAGKDIVPDGLQGTQVSGASKIRYTITGLDGGTINATTGNIVISQDGTNFDVVAYTIDAAGNESVASAKKSVKRDTQAPTDVKLTVGTPDYTSIQVTAAGKDATSGIESYKFYYSATSADDGWDKGVTVTADTSNPETYSYTYPGLLTGKNYWFKVEVTDKAGHTTTSEIAKGKTKGDLVAPNIELKSNVETDKMEQTNDGTWRKGKISITITDLGTAGKTSATQIKYQITNNDGKVVNSGQGAIPLTVNEAITEDDKLYTITAWTIGRETGDISKESSSRKVQRDATEPSTASLKVGESTYNSIPVTATGADATSGVAKYKFYYSTSENSGYDNGTEVTASTTSPNSQTHTYNNLATGTTYWLKVMVTDNAGNTATSTPISVKTLGELKAPTITLTSDITTESSIMDAGHDDSWRKGKISIKITDSATNATQSAVTKIRYTITKDGKSFDSQTQVGTSVDLTNKITADGTYEISAWAIGRTDTEEAGPTTRTVKRDTVAPGVPSGQITTGTKKITNGEWYTSNVILQLTAGADPTPSSGIKQIIYGTTSSNLNQSLTGSSGQVTIASDGTTTIYAKTEDNAGNITASPYSITIKRDAANPTKATLTQKGDAGTDTIEVTAEGADITSGVASYTFQKSTTSKTTGFDTGETVTIAATSTTYTYRNLEDDTTYYLRVVVKDNAGNEKIGEAIEVTTEKAMLSIDELADRVGDYVDYQRWIDGWDADAHSGGSTYNADRTGRDVDVSADGGIDYYSGVNEGIKDGKVTAQNTAHTTEDLHWRIYSVNKETKEMLIISDVPTNYRLTLYGHDGYNNAVKLLDDMCAECYSSLELGTEARSINMEDIDAVSSFKKETDSSYGKTESPSKKYYPNIYAEEKDAIVNDKAGTKESRSTQTQWYTGYSTANTWTTKYTYYSYSMSGTYMTKKYLDLIRYKPGTTTNQSYYWVASRCVFYSSGYAAFSVFSVYGGDVSTSNLFYSHNYRYYDDYSVRPVVSISLQTTYVGETGDGQKDTPYSLRPVDLIGKYIDYGKFIDKNADGTAKYYNADAPAGNTDPDYKDATNGKYGINHYSSGDGVADGNKNATTPTTEDLNWRIFKIAGNEMTLISDVPTTYSLRLYGYEGYNNGVKLLNDLCKTCYSSAELGTEARSINMEDIDAVSTYNKYTYSSYGGTSSPSNKNYPNIYAEEKDAIVNTKAGTKESRSTQTEWYTGYSQASTWTTKYTYYYYTMSTTYMTEKYLDLIRYKPGTHTNQTDYWVASRCVNGNSSERFFDVFCVLSGDVSAQILFYSDNDINYDDNSVRPVVTINLSDIDLTIQKADGTLYGNSATDEIKLTKKAST